MTVQCGDEDLVTRQTRTLFHQCKVVDVFGVRNGMGWDGMIVHDVRGHKVTHQREAWMHEREMGEALFESERQALFVLVSTDGDHV